MKKFIVTWAIVILLFLPGRASAEKVIFGSSEWPPYLMYEKGRVTGMQTKVVLELCKRLNIESVIRVLPWKRALMYAKKGKVDAVFSARRTRKREKFLYYSSEPLMRERTVILAPKGSGMKVTGLGDLKGKAIGVVRGYAYDPTFDSYPGIKRLICNDDEQMVKIFVKKRAALIMGADEGSMKYLCKKAGIETEMVYVLNEAPSYIAFSRAIGERGRILAEKFADAIRQLKKEGFIKKIQDKYF